MDGYRRRLVRAVSDLGSKVGNSLVTGTRDEVRKQRGPYTRRKSGPEVSGVK